MPRPNNSKQAHRRIGPTQALSLLGVQGGLQPITVPSSPSFTQTQYPATVSGRPSQPLEPTANAVGRPYNTLATQGQNGYASEFGYNRPVSSANEESTSSSTPNARVPPSAAFTGQRRLTVTNMNEADLNGSMDSLVDRGPRPSPPAPAPVPKPAPQQWLTAEQEKQRLYEQARRQAELVQGAVVTPTAPVVVSCISYGCRPVLTKVYDKGGGAYSFVSTHRCWSYHHSTGRCEPPS